MQSLHLQKQRGLSWFGPGVRPIKGSPFSAVQALSHPSPSDMRLSVLVFAATIFYFPLFAFFLIFLCSNKPQHRVLLAAGAPGADVMRAVRLILHSPLTGKPCVTVVMNVNAIATGHFTRITVKER